MKRRRFLRQLGAAVMAGIGVSVIPAAALGGGSCCPSTSCPTCQSPYHRFRCKGASCDYCICTTRTTCWAIGCP